MLQNWGDQQVDREPNFDRSQETNLAKAVGLRVKQIKSRFSCF